MNNQSFIAMKPERIIPVIGILVLLCFSCKTQTTDPIEQKVKNLLSQMTLDEKIGQMVQVHGGYFKDQKDMEQMVRDGQVGSFLNVFGTARVNALQKIAVEESRLGIPLIIGRDVIHGYKTIFPIPLGIAATWNPEGARLACAIAAKEAKAQGINWTFAPMMDVCWDPRWGRIAEGYGEDPFMAEQFAVAMVKGFQGDDPASEFSIAACAKHYVGYGMSEAGRDYNTTYIPEVLLRNVHLRPFKAVADAGCLTFMSAFNDLNGVPASGNAFTLKTILRDEWNYKGFVVSDWASISEMILHGYAGNEKEAAEKAFNAGVDMEMVTQTYSKNIKTLLDEGKISAAMIDEHVGNILRVKYKLGLFDHPYVDESMADKVTLTAENLDQARQVARESMVLLKNDRHLLPLSKDSRVALIGPMTNAPHDQLGTWSVDGDAENSVTPRAAFEALLGSRLLYATGLEYSRDKSTAGFAEALAAARKSDVVVFVAGEESILSGEANARGILDLPGAQSQLIAELAKTGKPLVLVVLAGRPLGIGADIDHSTAVLYAWHPGTMAGPALTDLLFGDYSPSGKLPVTMVKGAGQIPFYYYRKNTGRPADPNNLKLIDEIPRNTKQLSVGFRSMHLDYGITPLYPFGYGLSYTTFEYGETSLSADTLCLGGSLTATCRISNTGNVVALEVVQLYVRDVSGSITRPIKELKGFEKIELKPGEVKEVSFTIFPDNLKFFNGSGYVTEPGEFRVWIAPNSDAGDYKTFFFK